MRRTWTDGMIWGLAAIILAMAAAIGIAGSIKSHAADMREAQEAYYEQLEREYIGQVKQFLTQQGYRYSGVTLSRTVDGEGLRSYRLSVHHSGLDRLEDEALSEMLGQMEEMGFQLPGCSFEAGLLQ